MLTNYIEKILLKYAQRYFFENVKEPIFIQALYFKFLYIHNDNTIKIE